MEEIKNVHPMEQRRLVTYINNFITTTVSFLNNFMTHCEAKMMKSEQRLQKISASLCILETKLNSVPELRELEPQQIPTNESTVNEFNEKKKDNLHNSEETKEQKKSEENIALESVEPAIINESPKESTVEDPTILKYRKMLQVGVPRGAVELKMVHEGLDPKLL